MADGLTATLGTNAPAIRVNNNSTTESADDVEICHLSINCNGANQSDSYNTSAIRGRGRNWRVDNVEVYNSKGSTAVENFVIFLEDRDDAVGSGQLTGGGQITNCIFRTPAGNSASQTEYSFLAVNSATEQSPGGSAIATASTLFSDSGGDLLVSPTAHGYVTNDILYFSDRLNSTGVLASNIQPDYPYYVEYVTDNSFKLKLSLEGGAVPWVDAGSGTVDRYEAYAEESTVSGTWLIENNCFYDVPFDVSTNNNYSFKGLSLTGPYGGIIRGNRFYKFDGTCINQNAFSITHDLLIENNQFIDVNRGISILTNDDSTRYYRTTIRGNMIRMGAHTHVYTDGSTLPSFYGIMLQGDADGICMFTRVYDNHISGPAKDNIISIGDDTDTNTVVCGIGIFYTSSLTTIIEYTSIFDNWIDIGVYQDDAENVAVFESRDGEIVISTASDLYDATALKRPIVRFWNNRRYDGREVTVIWDQHSGSTGAWGRLGSNSIEMESVEKRVLFEEFLGAEDTFSLGWSKAESTASITTAASTGASEFGVAQLVGTTGTGDAKYCSLYLNPIQIPASGNQYDIQMDFKLKRPLMDYAYFIAPASITDSGGDLSFAETGHGWSNNDIVRVENASGSANLPTGLARATDYYVIATDADNFKLSASAGPGAAIAYTDSGSGNTKVFSAVSEFLIGLADTTDYGTTRIPKGVFFTCLDNVGVSPGNPRFSAWIKNVSSTTKQFVNEFESSADDWMNVRIFIPATLDYVTYEVNGEKRFDAYSKTINSIVGTNIPTATDLYPMIAFREDVHTARTGSAAELQVDHFRIQFVRTGTGTGNP